MGHKIREVACNVSSLYFFVAVKTSLFTINAYLLEFCLSITYISWYNEVMMRLTESTHVENGIWLWQLLIH